MPTYYKGMIEHIVTKIDDLKSQMNEVVTLRRENLTFATDAETRAQAKTRVVAAIKAHDAACVTCAAFTPEEDPDPSE